MAVNLLLLSAAVMRWKDRLTDNLSAANAFEQYLDEAYENEAMEKNYPNMNQKHFNQFPCHCYFVL